MRATFLTSCEGSKQMQRKKIFLCGNTFSSLCPKNAFANLFSNNAAIWTKVRDLSPLRTSLSNSMTDFATPKALGGSTSCTSLAPSKSCKSWPLLAFDGDDDELKAQRKATLWPRSRSPAGSATTSQVTRVGGRPRPTPYTSRKSARQNGLSVE